MKKKISILGSTGSIGVQTLDVIANFPERFEVIGLSAGKNFKLLAQQIIRFRPRIVAIMDQECAKILREKFAVNGVKVVSGMEGLIEVATESSVDLVISSLVGIAGLLPTLAAIEHGKDIGLANKETLVAAGELVMRQASRRGVRILPVDSEHSAIFQCLQGHHSSFLHKIILTASGGPFRGYTIDELKQVTDEQVLRHPTWQMGKKITVDSATLMNKGFELIEAKWLFHIDLSQIEVVIHPQSIVHSMVEFVDGSVLAQLGIPDMRLPIQYALTYPERLTNSLPRLDLVRYAALTFEAPDVDTFPCLSYAYQACRKGGTMPAVLNAANEVAVNAFLDKKIAFYEIPQLINTVMTRHKVKQDPGLHDILDADQWARETTLDLLKE